ncbi:UNVERIFIED_CONTAM: hypothetical protein K2H54_051979 [Gekko kuhli]
MVLRPREEEAESKMAAAAAEAGAAVAAAAGSLPSPEPGSAQAPEEELPPLEADEIRSRVERSARQFRNRRKILIRGLPSDVANQAYKIRESG